MVVVDRVFQTVFHKLTFSTGLTLGNIIKSFLTIFLNFDVRNNYQKNDGRMDVSIVAQLLDKKRNDAQNPILNLNEIKRYQAKKRNTVDSRSNVFQFNSIH